MITTARFGTTSLCIGEAGGRARTLLMGRVSADVVDLGDRTDPVVRA